MSRIFITGDTHQDVDVHKLDKKRWADQHELTKDDFLIIAGDFGGIFYGNGKDDFWLEYHSHKRYTTLVCLGNHENYDLINQIPTEEWHGGLIRRARRDVLILERGAVYDLNGVSLFTMGGASSHDIASRLPGQSWWPQELPSQEEYDRAEAALNAHNRSVDLIVSHCAPGSIQQKLAAPFYKGDRLTEYLDSVAATVNFSQWYFGHYHTDRSALGKFHCLYDTIAEFKK